VVSVDKLICSANDKINAKFAVKGCGYFDYLRYITNQSHVYSKLYVQLTT